MKCSVIVKNTSESVENIGSLKEFMSSTEEPPFKIFDHSRYTFKNSSASRNASALSCRWIPKKTPDNKISSIKNLNPISFATKQLIISNPTVVKVKFDENTKNAFDKSPTASRPQSCAPDYSNIKCKINSFRDRTDKNDMKFRVSLQDKVRNEILYMKFRLKKNQIILRAMNKAKRKYEKQDPSNNNETETAFLRLAEHINNYNSPIKEPLKLIRIQGSSNVVQKSSYATIKNMKISQSKWLKSHCINFTQNSIPITKQIISMLDPHSFNEVPVEDFISFLIEIGTPVSVKSITHIMRSLLKAKDLKNKFIREDHVSILCKTDKLQDRILKILNQEILKTNNKSLEDVTSADQNGLIDSWWKDLDTTSSKIVSCNHICDFLVKTKMFSEYIDAKKYIGNICKSRGGFMDNSQFRMIFALVLIKYVLLNINKKFTEEDWNDPAVSYAFKLCQLKRKLILAGIKFPIPKISAEEGELVLRALENVGVANGEQKKQISFDDFKEMWVKNTGICVENSYPELDFPLKTIESQPELAIFYPKSEKNTTHDEANQDQTCYQQEKNSYEQPSNSFRDQIQQSTLGFLLFGDIERKANTQKSKVIKKNTTEVEAKQIKQKALYSDFQKVVNTITELC